MAKIILTSRYLRNASKETLRNYVRYIGTREGVERIPAENKKESGKYPPETAGAADNQGFSRFEKNVGI